MQNNLRSLQSMWVQAQHTCRSGGVAIMACLVPCCLLPEGEAPLLEARPPCMVIVVGEGYALLLLVVLLPVLMLPAESLLCSISLLARCSTSS